MEIVFLLSAEIDLFDAYEQHGDALHEKIEAALRLIEVYPEIAPKFRSAFRRKLVLRSPFAIYYTIEGRRIIVHAIFDQRQDPQKIIDRLTKG